MIASNSFAIPGHKSSNYNLSGTVFFDHNMNGIMDENDYGISGAKIDFDAKKKIITNQTGKFHIQAKSATLSPSLQLHIDSLPAGSIPTSTDHHYLNKKTGYYRALNFGINYPEGKVIYQIEKASQKHHFLLLNNQIDSSIIYNQDGIKINGYKWKDEQDFKISKKKENKKFNISFSKLKLTIDSGSTKALDRYLRLHKDEIETIMIYVSLMEDEKIDSDKERKQSLRSKMDLLADELKIHLQKQGIRSKKIQRITKIAEPTLKLQISSNSLPNKNDLCRIDLPTELSGKRIMKLRYNKKIKITHNIQEPQTYKITCAEITHSFSFPKLLLGKSQQGWNDGTNYIDPSNKQLAHLNFTTTNNALLTFDGKKIRNNRLTLSLYSLKEIIEIDVVEKGINYTLPLKFNVPFYYDDQRVKDQGELTLYHSKYLEESRDLDVHFRGSSKKTVKVKINGKKYEKKEFLYHYQGKRGYNHLDIFLQDRFGNKKRDKFEFRLYPEPRVITQIGWGMHKKVSSTDFYKTSYTLPAVKYVDGTIHYFPYHHWGTSLYYRTDIMPIQLNKVSGGVLETKHRELKLHLLHRLFLRPTKFFTTKFTFYGGIQKKDFISDEEQVTVNFPHPFFGLHGGIEMLNQYVIFNPIDLATSAFVGTSLKYAGDLTLQISQEIRFSLNKVGALFAMKPYFNHHYRYKMFQKFQLILTGTLEQDRRQISNASRGNVNETKYLVNLGLRLNY